MTTDFLLFFILQIYLIIHLVTIPSHVHTCSCKRYIESPHVYMRMCSIFFCWIQKETEVLFNYLLPWFLFRNARLRNVRIFFSSYMSHALIISSHLYLHQSIHIIAKSYLSSFTHFKICLVLIFFLESFGFWALL